MLKRLLDTLNALRKSNVNKCASFFFFIIFPPFLLSFVVVFVGAAFTQVGEIERISNSNSMRQREIEIAMVVYEVYYHIHASRRRTSGEQI